MNMMKTTTPVRMLKMSKAIHSLAAPPTKIEIISVNQEIPISMNKLNITRNLQREYKGSLKCVIRLKIIYRFILYILLRCFPFPNCQSVFTCSIERDGS